MPLPELLPLPVAIPDDLVPPTLWRLADVAGPGTANRDILVALPPGYDANPGRRYRVAYLQDGQNCFDPETSYAGHWGLLETLADRHGPTVAEVAEPLDGDDIPDESLRCPAFAAARFLGQ